MVEDDGEQRSAFTSRDDRSDPSRTSRRALLTAGFALSAGCLRLSEDEQTAAGDGNGSTQPDDGESTQSDEEDSDTEQTADELTVVASTGRVNENGEDIRAVSLTVQRSPGAGEVDLAEMSIGYAGPEGSQTLVHASRDSPGFYLAALAAEEEDNAVMTADSDRYSIHIPFWPGDLSSEFEANDPVDGTGIVENAGLGSLGEGETARLRLTTAGGATRTENLVVPDTLQGAAGGSVSL